MSLRNWIRSSPVTTSATRQRHGTTKSGLRFRPAIDPLENRLTPATFELTQGTFTVAAPSSSDSANSLNHDLYVIGGITNGTTNGNASAKNVGTFTTEAKSATYHETGDSQTFFDGHYQAPASLSQAESDVTLRIQRTGNETDDSPVSVKLSYQSFVLNVSGDNKFTISINGVEQKSYVGSQFPDPDTFLAKIGDSVHIHMISDGGTQAFTAATLNSYEYSVTVQPGADLAVDPQTGLTASDTNVVLNYDVTSAPLGGSAGVNFYWSDTPQLSATATDTGVTRTTETGVGHHTITVPGAEFGTPPDGSRYLIAVLDKAAAVAETNENNNQTSLELNLDLEITEAVYDAGQNGLFSGAYEFALEKARFSFNDHDLTATITVRNNSPFHTGPVNLQAHTCEISASAECLLGIDREQLADGLAPQEERAITVDGWYDPIYSFDERLVNGFDFIVEAKHKGDKLPDLVTENNTRTETLAEQTALLQTAMSTLNTIANLELNFGWGTAAYHLYHFLDRSGSVVNWTPGSPTVEETRADPAFQGKVFDVQGYIRQRILAYANQTHPLGPTTYSLNDVFGITTAIPAIVLAGEFALGNFDFESLDFSPDLFLAFHGIQDREAVITDLTANDRVVDGRRVVTYSGSVGFILHDVFEFEPGDASHAFNAPARFLQLAGWGTPFVNSIMLVVPLSDSIDLGPEELSPRSARRMFAAGGGPNGATMVFTPNGSGGYDATPSAVQPFGTFGGDVRTALADVNGDGIVDYIGGAGAGGGPRIAVVDGKTGATIADFLAFEASFTGGVYVTAADLDGDGLAEVIVSPDRGGGLVITIYSGARLTAGQTGDAAQIVRFFGIDDKLFRGGARATAGDLDGDGTPDLIVSAGFLGGPRIAVFSGKQLVTRAAELQGRGTPDDSFRLIADFFAFEDTLRNGAFVAAGDVDGDGRADLAFGGGPGGAPRIRVIDGRALLAAGSFANLDEIAGTAQRANFFAGDTALRGGVRPALRDADGDGKADLVTGSGEGEASHVRVYRSATLLAPTAPAPDQDLDPFGAVLPSGVYVG